MEVLVQVLLNVCVGWWSGREAGLSWPRGKQSEFVSVSASAGAMASFVTISWAWFAVICAIIFACDGFDQAFYDGAIQWGSLGYVLPAIGGCVASMLMGSRCRWRSTVLPDLLESDWRTGGYGHRPSIIVLPGRSSSVGASSGSAPVPSPRSFNAPSVMYITGGMNSDLSYAGSDIGGGGGGGGSSFGGLPSGGDGKGAMIVLFIAAIVLALCLSFFTTRKLIRYYANTFANWVREDVRHFRTLKEREAIAR